MPNLLDYIHETGDRSFREQPFSGPDSLALTQIVYMPMEGLLDHGGSVTVRELWAFLARTYPEGLTDPFQRKRYFFTAACAAYDRLGDVTVSRYVNHIDAQQETQFCACVFTLPDGTAYIAFRGTDLTLAGWKEDLNMSFKRVPAQAEAVAYVQSVADAFGGPLMTGGHSKGGHLALFAATSQPDAIRPRISRVYSFDGPGVDQQTLASEGYLDISQRVESYIPQSSVVGMLLCYHPVYRVVRSNALGLLQHDALTWQVRDGAFETLAGLDLGTRVTDEALRLWIDNLTIEDRHLLTDAVFRIISSIDPETIDPLVQDPAGSSIRMLSAFRRLEPETRVQVRRMLGELFASGANEAARMLLPGTFRRIAEMPLPLLRGATKNDGAQPSKESSHFPL